MRLILEISRSQHPQQPAPDRSVQCNGYVRSCAVYPVWFHQEELKEETASSTSAFSVHWGGISILKLCVCLLSFTKPLFVLILACWLTGHFWLFQSWATVKPSPLWEKLQTDCTFLFTISQTCRTQGKTREDWQYGGWISLKWWSSLMAFAVPLPSPEPSNKRRQIRILRWRMGGTQSHAMSGGKSKSSHEEEGKKPKNSMKLKNNGK